MPTPSITKSDTTVPTLSAIETLLSTGRQLNAVVTHSGCQPSIIIPEGHKVVPMEFEKDPPLRDFIKQAVLLKDAPSFCKYVADFKVRPTRVFYSTPAIQRLLAGEVASFLAVLDYHLDESGLPNHAAHTARYDCPYSIEWLTWLGAAGKPMTQEAFINFVEANGPDIEMPDSAHLMEMALNFEAATNGTFSNKVDRVTGGRALTFTENIEAGTQVQGQRIKVPEAMRISVPVFDGGDPYELDARLTWEPKGGKLAVTIHLQRPHIVLRNALNHVRQSLQSALGIEILTGQLLSN